jgi:hypothetical protein
LVGYANTKHCLSGSLYSAWPIATFRMPTPSTPHRWSWETPAGVAVMMMSRGGKRDLLRAAR